MLVVLVEETTATTDHNPSKNLIGGKLRQWRKKVSDNSVRNKENNGYLGEDTRVPTSNEEDIAYK